MTHHHTPAVDRHCDVVVVGGSAAGLAAALQLVRQRRSVIVIDDDTPRNAPASHLHGYLGHDGRPPSDLLAIGRAEVRSYGGEVLTGRVTDVVRTGDDRFRVETANGHTIVARRVLAATGLLDELPDVDGLADHWGHDVIHCPFCHGYEARDTRIVFLLTHPLAMHPAALFHQLSARLTIVVADGLDVDDSTLKALQAAGVSVIHGQAQRVIAGDNGRVTAVELADGTLIEADTVVVNSRFRARTAPFETLALHAVEHPSGLGSAVETDATGLTTVPGVYAAGNIVDPSEQVINAAADGARTGAMIAFDLAHADLNAGSRHSPHETEWDHRYSGDQVWSGHPNGTFAHEVAQLSPGRALDVGAGEGGDALWLAEHGWHVTASDISQRALDRIAAAARERGASITYQHTDANAHDAFGGEQFDLVSAQYASIPRTPDDRAIRQLLDAVAPGGILLVVSHDLTPLRAPRDPATEGPAFDPDAYVGADAIAVALDDEPGWTVEIHETRPRPAGAISESHHVDDTVLRARRHATGVEVDGDN